MVRHQVAGRLVSPFLLRFYRLLGSCEKSRIGV